MQNDKVCPKCGKTLDFVKKENYIIPQSWKNRKNNVNKNLTNLYPDKKNYIKPSRLQIFNDLEDEHDNDNIFFNDDNVDQTTPLEDDINLANDSENNFNSNISSDVNGNAYVQSIQTNNSSIKKAKRTKPIFFKNLEEIFPKEIARRNSFR